MNGVNKVILLGTLGKDPQGYTSKDGKTYAALSLATNRTWKDKDGEKGEKTEWHRVTVWGKRAELCQQFLKKGSGVYIEGYLATAEIEDPEGKKRWNTYINADQVTFLPSTARSP